MTVDLSAKRVLLTGGGGFVGRVVRRLLAERGCADDMVSAPRRAECDMTDQAAVGRLFASVRPEVVIHLAAEVGGIGANRAHPGRFFHANMAMALHLIEAARVHGTETFVQVGSICSYPKHCPVPFREETLWDGYPEETNGPYGVAKKAAGVMLDAYCREYGMRGAYVLPVNLYGPHDNFDLETSHVIPALVRKFVEAQQRGDDEVEVWGTGTPTREFLYVDDCAEAVVRAAERLEDPAPVNIGTGEEITIRQLVEAIGAATGFEGSIRWDTSRPDGQPRRGLDTSRAAERLGWRAEVDLAEGLRRTVAWFRAEREV